MATRVLVPACLVLLCLPPAVRAGTTIDDQRLKFRLTLPDGFEPFSDKVAGNIIYAFRKQPTEAAKGPTFIFVERLGGTIGRERLADLPAKKASNVEVFEEHWKSFTVEVMRVPEQADGVAYLTFNVQVPLKPEAIQIKVFGEASREEELRALVRSLLEKLEGESNWLTEEERHKRLIDGWTAVAKVAAVIVIPLIILWSYLRTRRKQRARERLRKKESDGAGDRPGGQERP